MRYTEKKDHDKYGCTDCFDKRRGRHGIKCPYEDCPYKAEFGKYKNYRDFLKKTRLNIGAIVKASGGKKDGNNRKRVTAVESGLITAQASSTAPPAMRRPPPRVWLPESTPP